MIQRKIEEKLKYYVTKYPVVTVTGPRQSGKTKLIKNCFPDYHYISFEDPDMLNIAKEDPRLFLRNYPDKTIIDEVQRFPEFFSYLQTHVDNEGKEGLYILSGSHNFLLMEKISQTLSGRTAILKLMPFSYKEIAGQGKASDNIDEVIYKGLYPRIFDKTLKPEDFYPFYIQTYLERDVRLLINITDMSLFIRFLKLCAGRTGQLLNLSSLANECGISQPTAKAWLSVLEASYIIYCLYPYYKNFNKRLVKSPKLYFFDTGLACSLLGLKDTQQLSTHYMRGALFENHIITEYIKSKFNNIEEPDVYFWRDNTGNEIDMIFEEGNTLKAIEIKSGATYRQDFFKGILFWEKMNGKENTNAVVYGGDISLSTTSGQLIAWKDWV